MQYIHGGKVYELGMTVSDNIRYPSPLDLSQSPFTMSAFVYPTGSNQKSILGIYGPSEWQMSMAQWQWGGHGQAVGFDKNYSGNTKYIYWSSVFGDPGTYNIWYHIVIGDAGTASQDDGFLYLNGEEITAKAGDQDGTGDPDPGGNYVSVGMDTAGNEYRVAHLGIWNRELEAGEIAQLPYRSPLFFREGLQFYDDISPPALWNKAHSPTRQIGNPAIEDVTIVSGDLPQVEQPILIRQWSMPSGPTTANLVVNNLSQSSTVNKVGITKESALAVDNLSQSNAVTVATLTQIHNLSLRDLDQSNLVEKKSLVLETSLAVDNLSQSNTVDKISIEPEGSVIGYALAQANTVSVPALTQVHNISVHDLSQANLVEKPWVNTAYQMAVNNLALASTLTKISLTQIHNITIADASQANVVQTVYLGEWWYEVHEEVGPVTTEYSVVGLVDQLYEDYGIIDMEHISNVFIDQEHEGDGEIGQTLDLEAPIAITHEQDGEI